MLCRNMAVVADTRNCQRCGTPFPPRREHARFCSVGCRVAWDREDTSDRTAEASALDWSVTAVREATRRLVRVRLRDRPIACAMIRDAVWCVTIVDGTLVRYHPEAYDVVLRGLERAERRLIEGTLAGLRFARNWMDDDTGQVAFIRPHAGHSGPDDGRITAWAWQPVPEPALASLPPRAQVWEMTRYRAYEAQLAGHTVGEIFERAAVFLGRAAAKAMPPPAAMNYAVPSSVPDRGP